MASQLRRGCVLCGSVRVSLMQIANLDRSPPLDRHNQDQTIDTPTTDSSTTRRDFILMAGMTTAGAKRGAASAKAIALPEGSHPAMMSAARILAKKLKLDESAIQTFDGAAPKIP